MKKQIVADGIIYLICMVVAVLLNLLISALLESIGITLGFAEYSQRAWIRVFSGFSVGIAILSAVVYRECHKSVQFYPVMLIPSVALAGGCQLVLAAIFGFNPIFSGGVRDLAGLILFGADFDSAAMVEKIGLPVCFFAFLIYLSLEILSAMLFGYWGMKRRIKNREGMVLSDGEPKQKL